MTSNPIVQTVGAAIQAVFPRGTNLPLYLSSILSEDELSAEKAIWQLCPVLATDLFAVAGHLCRIGGVVGFFDPNPYALSGADGQIVFDRTHRDLMDDIAWTWRGGMRGGRPDHPKFRETREHSDAPPDEVQEYWKTLLDAWDSPINCGFYVRRPDSTLPPLWWSSALSLMVIADLAVVRPFRDALTKFGNSPLSAYFQTLYDAADRDIEDASSANGTTSTPLLMAPRGPASFGMMSDTSVVCVMPKFRIAPVGTTNRNVTRNLALLPGRGEMRVCWDMTDAAPENEDKDTLDILLIPAPFKMTPMNFRANVSTPTAEGNIHHEKPDWESFSVDQDWISTEAKIVEFIRSCEDLLRKAKEETRSVNAVIFPEYALSHAVFDRVCTALKGVETALEFVVSGSSTNCDNDKANTVLTRVWQMRDKAKHLTNSRRKHHRWRLDRRQVEMYGLGTALNPKIKCWWEETPVGQRELHFHRFRQNSVFAALICEELARSDVCHDILRAVGPNLVFALLMDSAQLPGRWPGQYAAALADDPGCAVLSLTSYALVERSNQVRADGSRSIALWKDDTGKVVTIDMPKAEGPRAVLLSLWSESVSDQTIIGKRSQLRAWRYSSHVSITTKV